MVSLWEQVGTAVQRQHQEQPDTVTDQPGGRGPTWGVASWGLLAPYGFSKDGHCSAVGTLLCRWLSRSEVSGSSFFPFGSDM